MASNSSIVSFPLDLGMRNTSESQPQPIGPDPKLKASINTRVGIIDGVPSRAPAVVEQVAADDSRVALIPSGSGDMLVLSRVDNELVTADGDHASFLRSYLDSPSGTIRQNGYMSYVPETDSVVPGGRGRIYGTTAIAVTSSGDTWLAHMRFVGQSPTADCSVMVSVLAADGSIAAPPVVVTTTTPTATGTGWIGLTAHGDTCTLWYRTAAGTSVAYKRLSRSGTSIVDAGTVTLLAPNQISEAQLAVHSDNHASYAYLATVSAALATSITITRRDVVAGSSTTLTIATGANVRNIAIRHLTLASSQYVSVIVYGDDGTVRVWLIDGAAMTTTWGPINLGTGFPTGGGTVAVSFLIHPTHGDHVIAAATKSPFGFGQPILTNPAFTRFVPMAISDGSGSYSIECKWKGLISNGAWDRIESDGETIVQPLFGMQNWFSQTVNRIVGGDQWVSDPAAEIYRVYAPYNVTPVGRFGVDTADVRDGIPAGRSCNLAQGTDGRIWYSYLSSALTTTNDQATVTSRYVTLEADSPTVSTDSAGVTAIAAGPAYWDGVEVAEWCPMQRPVVVVEANTGTVAPTPGTYRLSAVVYFQDASGQVRRSYPAAVVTHTVAAAEQPKIYVTIPGSSSMRNSATQESIGIVLYSSMDGQSGPLYAQQAWTVTALGTYFAEYNAISTPTTGQYSPPIYTTGDASQPLGAQCPPSFVDVKIIGDRMWGLYADGSLWYSKPKQLGIAFEFSSQQTLALPASSGKPTGIEELNGNVVAFTSKGAWVITGQGPDAALGGGAFNAPEQVSNLPCTSKKSIARTPAGLFYQSGKRFATIGGDLGTSLLEDYEPLDGDEYTAVAIPNTKEVVWFCRDFSEASLHVVYNWKLRRFTAWEQQVTPGVYSQCLNAVTGEYWLLRGDGSLASMDPLSVGDAVISIITGDFRMGGQEESDCALQCILLSGKRLSDHGVIFGVGQDYVESSVMSRLEPYLPADIADSADATTSRYTLSLEPKASEGMRAVSASVLVDGAGDCVRLYGVTIVYSQKSGTKTTAVFTPAKR